MNTGPSLLSAPGGLRGIDPPRDLCLEEDNLAYLNRLQLKGKLAGQLAPMRRQAGLSPEESEQVDSRLRALETSERQNLGLLQIAMKSVTDSLAGLDADPDSLDQAGGHLPEAGP